MLEPSDRGGADASGDGRALEEEPRQRSRFVVPERAPEQAASIARLTELLAAADARAERAEDAERRADEAMVRADAAEAARRAVEGEAKVANDRAWASGEQLAVVERRAAAERERADRLHSIAAHERQDFLDAESCTRHEMQAVRQRADAAETAADQARAGANAATQIAEAMRQAEAARRAAGLLVRIRGAFRRE